IVDISKEMHLAPKIFKQDCEIDWKKNTIDIERLIRGISPYPTAFSRLTDDLSVKIFDAEIANYSNSGEPAQIHTDEKTYVYVCCGDGQWLSLKSIQLSGKKRLNIEEVLKGFDFGKFRFFATPNP
ncbi:MAG: methionyl-tRNA formyltransferase, partial [Bacteroidales bacterium]|nr:methionyl-tRNA formyltransferase [Bacteroidales bacterium]